MPPLNLRLLRRGDDGEWQRAWDELGLWALARSTANAYLGDIAARPEFVEDAASEALAKLVKKRRRLRSVAEIRGLLKRIARHTSIDWLRKHWLHWERPFPDDGQEGAGKDSDEALSRKLIKRVLSFVPEAIQHYDALIDELVAAAKLDILEKALLREHIAEGCTQQEFATKHGLPLGSIGNLLRDVLDRVSRALGIEEEVRRNLEATRTLRAEAPHNQKKRTAGAKNRPIKKAPTKAKSRQGRRTKISPRKIVISDGLRNR